MSAVFSHNLLLHIASLVGVSALLFRDQLVLRTVLLASTALSLIYLVTFPEIPLEAAFWTVVNLLINGIVMSRIVLDRTHLRLDTEKQTLFRALEGLSPGEFRELMRHATWRTAATQRILTREGAPVDKLFYVIDGAIGISKSGKCFPIPAQTFIGEVAFLRNSPASATVTIEPGTRTVEWSADELRTLSHRKPAMEAALLDLLNADLAAKVARA